MTEKTGPEGGEEFVEEAIQEPADAGQDQISQDAELAQYGEEVRKRIAEATAARREAERRAAEAAEALENTTRIARAAIEENKALKAGRGEADKAILDNLVDRLDSELTIAKEELRKAHEAGDVEKIAEGTAKVSMAASDLRRAQLAKAGYVPPREEQAAGAEPPANPQRPPAGPPPKAAEWIKRNSWFGKDLERTRVARAADAFVASLGYDKNSDAYYEELDRTIAMRFNSQPNSPNRDQGGSSPVTAPSGRSPDQPRQHPGKVTLSASEVAQAKRLGITVEQYAAAKRTGNVVI